MDEHGGFGAMLARLLEYRGPGAGEWAAGPEFDGVLAGAEPTEAWLRHLAPLLGLHEADLLILAGRPVPDELAPGDPGAASSVARLVQDAVHLTPERRGEVLRFVRAFPAAPHTGGGEWDWTAGDRSGPGHRLMRMVACRNLARAGTAYVMAVLTPSYLSATTWVGIARGAVELTSRLVTDIATVLGIDPGALAALVGVVLPEPPPAREPEAADGAALLWAARRLSAEQALEAAELAKRLRGANSSYYQVDLPGTRAAQRLRRS
ncbi:hypothetical protein AB0K51_15860 [Kitasatospora sp. NPDC049285]|uniref:hypothetical protein n=1 Tax=Kitasatospora sp. NPDC049285 TaxID=3157096 RepID=UPI003432394B